MSGRCTTAQCTGGFPKTDCYDQSSAVRPTQTVRTDEGYCPTADRPFWCAQPAFRNCLPSPNCGSLPGTGIPAEFDYDCDGIEDSFNNQDLGGTTGNYENTFCSGIGMTTEPCEGLMVPYVVSGACGQMGVMRECQLLQEGSINGVLVHTCTARNVNRFIECR